MWHNFSTFNSWWGFIKNHYYFATLNLYNVISSYFISVITFDVLFQIKSILPFTITYWPAMADMLCSLMPFYRFSHITN